MLRNTKFLLRYLFFCILLGMQNFSHAQEIYFASWGGAYQRALEKAWLDPFSNETGIEIYRDTEPEIAKIRAMVDTGNVQWDLVTGGGETLMRGIEYGLFSSISEDMVNQDSIISSIRNPYAIPTEIYASVIGYSKKKYTNDTPTTFSDFWNVEKFPGRRSLPDDPAAVLEAALIADGVPKEDVYQVLSSSEGMSRAISKVKEIKDHIAFWWSSGAQPVQALASGEIDMAIGWNGRFQSGIDNGLSIEMAWGDSISHVGYIMLINGAPNSQEAIKLLNYLTEPERQARISNFISYGPTSEKALQYIDATTLKKLPSTKERMNDTLFMDIKWWSRNSEQALEAYLSLIQD